MKQKLASVRKKLPPLSGLEREVMAVVWNLGDCTSGQVTTEFAKVRDLAPTTIRTVLANLRNKGYLKPIPSLERGFMLRPTVDRETVGRRSLKEVLASFFQGSPKQAIAYLLDEPEMTEQELTEIRRLLDDQKLKGKKS